MRQRVPRPALPASAEDVEAQYYDALQQGDLARLMAVWADDEEIVCVHPGGLRVIGAAAVRASYGAMLAEGGLAIAPEQVHRLQSLGVAVHHLVERVQVAGEQGPAQAFVTVTHVFVQTAQGWRLVAHHASPGRGEPPPAVQEWPATVH